MFSLTLEAQGQPHSACWALGLDAEVGAASGFGLHSVTVLAELHTGTGCGLTDQEEAKSQEGQHALSEPGG